MKPRRAGRSGNSARVPALDRVGLLDPLQCPSFSGGLETPKHGGACLLGASALDRACLPCLEPPRDRAVRQRHDDPRATPPNDPASQRNQRRRDAFHPVESGRPTREGFLPHAVDRSGIGRCRNSHAQTILLRQTSHKKRYVLRHAARRRCSPSTRLSSTRLRALRERPRGSCVWSVEWPKLGWLDVRPPLARRPSVLPAFPTSSALTRDA